MASPGTEVTELEDPTIGFGDNGDKEKYGGYAYSLDFNLALIDPIRVSISFISEDRKYDFTELKNDISEVGVKQDPTFIRYCGEKVFWGYPLKYSVNRSPRGDILTVDYYDASIVELDNTFVLLNKTDIPFVNEEADADKCLDYEFIKENPCPKRIFNVGSTYVKKGAGLPDTNPACVPLAGLETEILYSNLELAALIKEHIPVDEDSLEALTHTTNDEGEREETLYLENYHGTLRQVLRSWGERMGFTFYWDSERVENDSLFGALVFINLKDPIFYTSLKETVDLMLGMVEGGACNLLDSTEALSMEQTFNKAISANYTNSSIGQVSNIDNLMMLDLFTLPIRGCVTDKGNEFGSDEYDGPLKPDTRFVGGTPQWRWWQGDKEWYKEWDNPEYHPKGDEIKRVWLEYQPKRPLVGAGDTIKSREFRDYVRLVKAAALGQEFFKAYVFFKSIKSSDQKEEVRTLADYAMEHFKIDSNGGTNINPNIIPCDCRGAVAAIKKMGGCLSQGGGGNLICGQEIDDLDICPADLPNGPNRDAEIARIMRAMDGWNVHIPEAEQDLTGIETASDTAVASAPYADKIIPDLVENTALTKILSQDAQGGSPDVATPNIKLCRGTILGKNCLTVKVLDPGYKAVQFLYRQSSNQWGPCGGKNEMLSVDLVDEASDVWRILADNNGVPPDPADATKNGHPYIFTYTHNYGNSMVLGDAKHNALYLQLKTVAENAGRWYISPELVTEREFNLRSYSEKDISWSNKLVDANDTSFRGIFQAFDALAGSSIKPWSDTEDIYNNFWGEPFEKSGDSKQKQLNYFQEEEGPDDPLLLSRPCDYTGGLPFNPILSNTPENSRSPNLEQLIEKIIEKTLKHSTDDNCAQDLKMGDMNPLRPASFIVDIGSVNEVLSEEGDLLGYALKSVYYNGEDFSGGFGYSMAVNQGEGPKIDFGTDDLSITPIIVDNIISEIIIENPEGVIFSPDAFPFDVVIDAPVDGEINFFKELKTDTRMENMDSIKAQNLSLRNRQRKLACCCTDLEEGVVTYDAGEQLRIHFSSAVQKQIERLSRATNLPINSTYNSNLVNDYKRDNKLITFSTNLIPLATANVQGLDPTVSPEAEDELDWIVDQIQIGQGGIDPTFAQTFYGAPTNFSISSLTCALPVKTESYLTEGDPFSITTLAIPELKEDGDGFNEFTVKTIPNPKEEERIVDCRGFLGGEHGINAREMQIEFVSPTSDDLKIDFECGKTWADLTEEERNELICEIQEKLIKFAKKRAYLMNRESYEASVTIADLTLLDSGGDKVAFGDNGSGIPNIDQGLESLSIKIDGNGQRISFSVGTRKKLMSLRDPNADLWREINPATANWLQPNVGKQ